MKDPGLIQIYTGAGKGKSTAAFGLCLRASGWGMRSAIVQFMKMDGACGEIKAISQLPLIDIYSYGNGKFLKKGEPLTQEDLACANEAMAKGKELMADPNIDILVLDELCNAIYFELVSEEAVLNLLVGRRVDQEIVITGRNAPPALLNLADLVSEMKEIKHPYRKGINSRKGIEY